MKKTFVYAAVIAACAVSCAKNELVETPSEEPVEVQFSAASEACTKTVIGADGKTVEWKAGDKVSLLFGEKNLLYTAESDGATTSLVPSGEGLMSNEGAVWAVYPYSSDNTVSESGVSMTVPATHSVSATGFAEGSNVAVAYAPELQGNTTLNFKNVCSYLKLIFKAEQGVNKVVLSSEGNAVALAGTATVKMNADGIPELVSVAPGAATSVTLESTDALDGIYLIPVLPGDAAKWQLNFTKTDGTVSTAAMGKAAAAFERNTPLSYDFSGVSINWQQAPTAVTADKVFWSDAHISWTHEGKADSYEVYVNNELSTTAESGATTAHITGLANGTTYSIKVAAVYGAEKKESEAVSITTGKIEQLVKNVSPTSVAVGIENRAGALAYSENTTSPCLFVELYRDGDLENPVYSTYVLDAEKISMGHPFLKSIVINEKAATPEIRLAFGALEANTKYYFRIKSAEPYTYQSYTSKKYEMTASSKNGASEYSELVDLQTSEEHIAEANEILFQGFDDCSMETDFINSAMGLMPAFKGTTEGNATGQHKCASMFPTWDKGWCFYGLRTDIDKSDAFNCGWMSQITATSALFEISTVFGKPLTKPEFMVSDAVADNRVGSFAKGTTANPRNFKNFDNWFLTNKCYPHEGYMALGTFYDTNNNQRTNSAKGTLVTPSLAGTLTAEPQTCIVSFKALSVQGRAGSIIIGLYRGKSADDWTTPETIQIQNSNGTFDNAESWSSYSDSHKWYEYNFEIDLQKSDRLAFTSDGNSCICIDDIKIVLK